MFELSCKNGKINIEMTHKTIPTIASVFPIFIALSFSNQRENAAIPFKITIEITNKPSKENGSFVSNP